MIHNAPRIDPEGSLQRACGHCGKEFRTDNTQAKYCSEECKRAAGFQRWYSKPKNRKAVQRRMKRYQRAKRKANRKQVNQ